MTTAIALHHSEAGQGPVVVLLHGFPLSSVCWSEQQGALSDHYRVITPDLRGHGKSPVPDGVYDMDTMAQDVLALLDSLGIERAILLGHSMGGYVTLAAWKRAPQRFGALGLVASQAGADTPEGRQGRYTLADKVAAEGSKVAADAMLPRLFAPSLPTDSPLVKQVRDLVLGTQPAGIIGTLKGMAVRPDSSVMLPTIQVPVLILTGDQDQIIPPSKAQAMASALPKGTLAPIAGAGHMPMQEQPQATTAALRAFLDQVPR